MKKKIIRSCELKKGGSHVWVYLIKCTHKDGSHSYIVDDHYIYVTRKGEMVSNYGTETPFYDRDIAITTYNSIVKVWL